MRKTLTDRGVLALKPRAARYNFPDPECRGHFVRVTPNGARSFCAVTRDPTGKQVWTTLGAPDRMTIETARELAREVIRRVRAGLPAFEPRGETFGAIVENWRRRHVEANALRSAPEINRLLDAHILPAWRDRELAGIRRTDIAQLLDRIEDKHGSRAADYCLNVIRSCMNWHAARSDFAPPVIKGMRRQSPHAQARARVLSDDEIRAIWKQAEANGTFGAIVRMCLLTAQRSRKVAGMRWADYDHGEWTVPRDAREKETGGTLVLPPMARAIVDERAQLGDNPHVFAGRAHGPYRSFSQPKTAFDTKLPKAPKWVIHDLRRTARSLMSRAGVPNEHAERVLGHAIPGIAGVYDRHAYKDEKADALAKLAALIEAIVNPRSADVLPMTKRKKH